MADGPLTPAGFARALRVREQRVRRARRRDRGGEATRVASEMRARGRARVRGELRRSVSAVAVPIYRHLFSLFIYRLSLMPIDYYHFIYYYVIMMLMLMILLRC